MYNIFELSKVLRHHISNKTVLGDQCANFMNSGMNVPDSVFHEIFKLEIEKSGTNNIAIKGYPNSKGQVKLFKELCDIKEYTINKIWYLKGINTVNNILANPKYSAIIDKYDSKDYAEKQVLRSREIIEQNLKELDLKEKIILFKSEALGENFKEDKNRIRELAGKYYT